MKRILAFLATGSWPGTGNRIIQSVDRLFYQPSIAANLSSQTGGNHEGESPPPVSFSVHNALFFSPPSPVVDKFFFRAERIAEYAPRSDEGFTSSSFLLGRHPLPPPRAGPAFVGPCEVLPTRCLSEEEARFYADSDPLSPGARRWRRDDTYAENAKGPTTPDSEGPP